METYDRRLPVYLVLDCSESMLGEGIEALNTGLTTLMMDLYGDPEALLKAWVSIITFSDRAEQTVPLSPLLGLHLPELRVRPGTALGDALRLLSKAIDTEVHTTTPTRKGDWKPLVFLLTDGMPTDEWEQDAVDFARKKSANVIAIGCGEEADLHVLQQVADVVIQTSDSSESFRDLFLWISSSVSTVSQAVAVGPQAGITLDKLPDELSLVTAVVPKGDKRELLMFLALRCSTTARPYLIRYKADGPGYTPVRVHNIDEDYFRSKTNQTFTLDSTQVFGVLPCPYCTHTSAGNCACGGLMCLDPDTGSTVCPHCEQTCYFGEGGGDFSLSGRMG